MADKKQKKAVKKMEEKEGKKEQLKKEETPKTPREEAFFKSDMIGVSAEKNSEDIAALLEKNLKWSQIIYEQNRRINNKLLWAAIASWLRFLLIAVPLILAFLYLPPILRQVWSQYQIVLGDAAETNQIPSGLMEKYKDFLEGKNVNDLLK